MTSEINTGEAMVMKTLSALLDSKKYHLLNNITVDSGLGTTQIDHILVCQFGIFVIEVKHYSGTIYVKPDAAKWKQFIGNTSYTFQNPLRQNYKHTEAIKSMLDFINRDDIYSVVVFTGSAKLKNEVPGNVINIQDLVVYIKNISKKALTDNEVSLVIGKIERYRRTISGKTDVEHAAYLKQKYSNKPTVGKKIEKSKPQNNNNETSIFITSNNQDIQLKEEKSEESLNIDYEPFSKPKESHSGCIVSVFIYIFIACLIYSCSRSEVKDLQKSEISRNANSGKELEVRLEERKTNYLAIDPTKCNTIDYHPVNGQFMTMNSFDSTVGEIRTRLINKHSNPMLVYLRSSRNINKIYEIVFVNAGSEAWITTPNSDYSLSVMMGYIFFCENTLMPTGGTNTFIRGNILKSSTTLKERVIEFSEDTTGQVKATTYPVY